jgi:hypothetical protein
MRPRYPRFMDDDWPGARWRGATWIEFYGGPWDGTMVEEKQVPLQYLGKITAWPKGTTPEAMLDGSASPLGEYHPVSWADEDLQIVRLEWRDSRTRQR